MSTGPLLVIAAGVLGGILGPLLYVLLRPRPMCPECGGPLTRLRNCWDTPRVMRRCPACGCGVDVKGRAVGEKRPRRD